jgi:very-short-patch-repair endonuclease
MNQELLKSNIFYQRSGKRWNLRDCPMNITDFKSSMIEGSSLCNEEEYFDLKKFEDLYSKYISIWKAGDFPIYKKSRGSIVFGFARSNASLKFYIDRCFTEDRAKEILSQRQSTVSLDSFIKLYGREKGKIKFDSYVNKWKESISKHDKKELYKNWKNSPESYTNKINPQTGEIYKEDEIREKIKDDLSKGFRKVWQEYRMGLREKSFLNTTKEYYISKGFGDEEASKMLLERQSTFSLEKCIQKHGDLKGKEIFDKRNEKWLNTLDKKSDDEKKSIMLRKCRNFPRYSKESTDLFDDLMERLGPIEYKTFYADDEMILWDRIDKRPYFFDFSIPALKIIIEYNGSAFHPNKQVLSDSQWNDWKCPFTKQSAEEKHKKDEVKLNFARSCGYEILVIWDMQEYENKIKQCLDLIVNKIKYDKQRVDN